MKNHSRRRLVLIVRHRDVIQAEILNEISDDYVKADGDFVYDVTKPAAIQFEKRDKKIDEIASKLSIENLEGDELAARVYELTAIEKKKSTKSSDFVEISGRTGSIINIGDKVASDSVFYTSLETKIVDGTGKVLVLVECDVFGPIGNVPANTISFFPVTLSGITAVTNPQPFTNGYDAESDEKLLERYYEKIRTPATSNNKHHFRNWAKSVTGVGDARVFPLWNGDNTVKVVIIDSNMKPVSTELIEKVQNYIDPGGLGLGEGQSSLGSFCTVVSAGSKVIDIAFSVTLEEGFTNELVKQNVSQKVEEYLKNIAFKQNFVSYAQIGSMILDSDGVADYTGLLINNGTENIVLLNDEVAVLGGVSIA